jgi:hypothetical protein
MRTVVLVFKILNPKGRGGASLLLYWYLDQSFALQDLQEMLSTLSLQAFGAREESLKYSGPQSFGTIGKRSSSKPSFQSSNPGNHYRLTVRSRQSCKVLSGYFEEYPPLTTSKIVRLARWDLVLSFALSGPWLDHVDEIKHLIRLNIELTKTPKGT